MTPDLWMLERKTLLQDFGGSGQALGAKSPPKDQKTLHVMASRSSPFGPSSTGSLHEKLLIIFCDAQPNSSTTQHLTGLGNPGNLGSLRSAKLALSGARGTCRQCQASAQGRASHLPFQASRTGPMSENGEPYRTNVRERVATMSGPLSEKRETAQDVTSGPLS